MAATDFDWQSSRNDIIQRAFRIVGGLSLGESLTAEQYLQGTIALNDMAKSWQSEKVFLWTIRELDLDFTGGNASYSTATDPPYIAIDRAYWVNGTNLDPLLVMSYRDYEDISDKATVGSPTVIAYDQRSTSYIYPVPSADTTIKIFAVTRAKDFDTTTATGDFTPKWSEALIFGLAHRLSFEYPIELGEFDRIKEMADVSFKKAKRTDHGRGERNFVTGAFGR